MATQRDDYSDSILPSKGNLNLCKVRKERVLTLIMCGK